MRISVIEDNPSILAMVAAALEMYGHDVETYKSSFSFLNALHHTQRTPAYDLVIVDLFIDAYSGTKILDALEMLRPQTIPAILISAATENHFVPIKKRYPSLPILRKPFKIKALLSLINQTAVPA